MSSSCEDGCRICHTIKCQPQPILQHLASRTFVADLADVMHGDIYQPRIRDVQSITILPHVTCELWYPTQSSTNWFLKLFPDIINYVRKQFGKPIREALLPFCQEPYIFGSKQASISLQMVVLRNLGNADDPCVLSQCATWTE